MIQLITFIIFIVSASAIGVMLYKKIPVLTQLPQNGHYGFKKPEAIATLEKKIKAMHFDLFAKQMLLHKLLSKTRLWVLKTERKIDELLHGIRKKAQQLEGKK